MSNTTTANRYEVQPAPGTAWAVVDTVIDAIVSGAESENHAKEIAAEYERDFPNGIDVDEVVA